MHPHQYPSYPSDPSWPDEAGPVAVPPGFAPPGFDPAAFAPPPGRPPSAVPLGIGVAGAGLAAFAFLVSAALALLVYRNSAGDRDNDIVPVVVLVEIGVVAALVLVYSMVLILRRRDAGRSGIVWTGAAVLPWTVLTAAGPELRNTSVLLEDGKVTAIGTALAAPEGAMVVDGTGKFVTPGLIDTHSHLGVYAAPGTFAESDGNEATNPVTAEVWAEHSIWPQDPQIPLAVAGGVTVIQVLPGSANLIGGRSAVVRLVPARTVQQMKVPGAKYGLKMACGENPKRVYQSRGPSTRMGNMAGYRAAFIDAEEYRAKWDR